MLFVPPAAARLIRVHGTCLSEEELITLTDFLKTQRRPDYVLDVTEEKNEEPAADINGNEEYHEKYQPALKVAKKTFIRFTVLLFY